jgi:hypothetical protein
MQVRRSATCQHQFLKTIGYWLEKITGKPHRFFINAKEAHSPDMSSF